MTKNAFRARRMMQAEASGSPDPPASLAGTVGEPRPAGKPGGIVQWPYTGLSSARWPALIVQWAVKYACLVLVALTERSVQANEAGGGHGEP